MQPGTVTVLRLFTNSFGHSAPNGPWYQRIPDRAFRTQVSDIIAGIGVDCTLAAVVKRRVKMKEMGVETQAEIARRKPLAGNSHDPRHRSLPKNEMSSPQIIGYF